MHYSFSFFGHVNILGTHKNTVEFTKDKNLTKEGDCIIGVSCDFNCNELKKIVSESKRINVKITINDLMEEITAEANPDFNDSHEFVIRKSNFKSSRTLGVYSNKAAIDINRKIIDKLKNPKTQGIVEIYSKT